MNEQVLNLKFVGEVEKYPLLYNYRLPEDSRKDLTEKAWTKVGKEVNLSVPECKDKWKNLRAVFVRHTKPAPSGSAAKKKKPYYLMSAMQFALPYVKAVIPTLHGNLPQLEKRAGDVEKSAAEETLHLEDPSEPRVVEHTQQIDTDPITTSEYSYLQTPKPCKPQHNTLSEKCSTSQKQKRSFEAADKSFVEYFNTKRAALESKNSDSSESKRQFLLSLLPEVDEMNNRQMKIFKRRVLQLIDEIMDSDQPTCTSSLASSFSSPLLSPVPSQPSYYEVVQQDVENTGFSKEFEGTNDKNIEKEMPDPSGETMFLTLC